VAEGSESAGFLARLNQGSPQEVGLPFEDFTQGLPNLRIVRLIAATHRDLRAGDMRGTHATTSIYRPSRIAVIVV
jgi:hypothetical protein